MTKYIFMEIDNPALIFIREYAWIFKALMINNMKRIEIQD